MRIKEMLLYGFKSFPHKTAIRFSAGINAIIGPNGCGKSNILDALRWVLGEQSFSLLRCGKNEDVIFSGTAQIPALGYAEVRLVMENSGDLPSFGSEIEIRRRYFRSGESEYYLNRNQCRLKDIQDVFFDSGIGTKAYSIFDLRSLRSIIAGELRPMLEEAATLAKYRARKTDCLRKLELTDTDLTRLNDIVSERERITRSLKRQAYRLSAYDRLKGEEKRLRLLLLREQYLAAQEQEQRAAGALAASEQADAGLLANLQQAEAELERLHAELATSREQRERLSAEAGELRNQLGRNESRRAIIENDAQHGQEEVKQLSAEAGRLQVEIERKQAENKTRRLGVAELEKQETALAAELEQQRAATREQEERLLQLRRQRDQEKESARAALDARVELQRQILALEANIANAEDYRTRLKTELQGTEAKVQQSQAELERKAVELNAATQELEQARTALAEQRRQSEARQARLAELNLARQRLREELIAARQELGLLAPAQDEPRRAILSQKLGAQLLGSVSDFMSVPHDLERAVEAALFPIMDCFVIDAPGSAANAELLAGLNRDARWGFIINDEVRGSNDESTLSGSLAQLVQLKANAPALLRKTLAGTVLVNSLAEAWQRIVAQPSLTPDPRSPAPVSCVTRDGILLQNSGLVVLESAGLGKLTLERRVRELSARVAQGGQQAARLDAELEQLNREAEESRRTIDRDESRLLDLVNTRSNREARHAAGKLSLDELLAELNRVRSEAHNAAARLTELQARLQSAQQQLREQSTLIGNAETRASAREKDIREREAAVKSGLERATELLLSLTQAREQLNSRRAQSDLYQQDCTRDEERRAAIQQRLQEIQASATANDELRKTLASADEGLRAELSRREARLEQLDLSALNRREEALMKGLHEQRQAQEQSRQQTLDLKLKSLDAVHRRSEIEQEAERLYGGKAGEPGGGSALFAAAAGAEAETDVTGRLRMITERLDRLGRVNPLAGEEFDKEKTELDRLVTQRADVIAAKDNLLKTVAEIDRFAREQFTSVFNTVREAFQEIFARLFVEGEADLLLDTPSDPLESGISIIAKPKGKSPKRLDQLSDGEKALLALSLLFAFYRVKPAPFCFLDEVDAPLDDANVDRFALFLKELSQATQVIIITHNRATVEQADVLFGVTTEAPGVSKVVSVKLGELGQAVNA
jgi:chromosome segregation protein